MPPIFVPELFLFMGLLCGFNWTLGAIATDAHEQYGFNPWGFWTYVHICLPILSGFSPWLIEFFKRLL